MDMRRADFLHRAPFLFILFAAIILLAGCRRSNSSAGSVPPESQPAPMQTVARIHWLGLTRLAQGTNAASFMAVWNLPESRKLEQQTLDKLSLAPWSLLHRHLATNAAALLPRMLSGLLDDVVSNESRLEIRCASNQPGELVFAIRLDDRRAALWQTNLAAALESLTGIRPVPAPDNHGWSLQKHHVPNFIQLARAGDWTLLGAAENQNNLLNEFQASLQSGQPPFPMENTNDWLEADLDPALLVSYLETLDHTNSNPAVLNFELSTLNHLHLALTGDGADVLSRGTAGFSRPLALDLKPWNIPTNLIDQHLSSFTFIRGFQPLLASSSIWTNLQIGPPPDQVYLWSLWGVFSQSYFVVPLADPSNAVDRLADRVLQNQKHWFVTNGIAKFEKSKAFGGLEWKGLPYMSPFLCSLATNHQNYIYGGGFPPAAVTQPVPLTGAQAALGQPNLVYHDWEMTGPRTEQCLYMSQFARLIFHKAQLPADSAGLLWLMALRPKLGVSVTDVAQTGPNQLSFTRSSNLGLTAVELNALADWLESPQFPCGLHTFLAPPPPM